MTTKFSMPYNGDPKLVDIVVSDFSDHVGSFYGSCGIDKFGGGRALNPEQCSSVEVLRHTVSMLERHGIEFNYVINTTNLLNREFNQEYQQYYLCFLRTLEAAGIRAVTLCNIFFIEFTRCHMPHWKVSSSVNLKTRTPSEVRFLIALGCNEITLHYDVLKDLKALADIRTMTDVELRLIANDIYIMGCPWQKGHTRMQGAHSREKGFETPYFSYYRNKCVNLRHYRPDEIFKARWIPPDQLWRYESIGYHNFKLLDRLATTGWNIRVLQSYIERRSVPLEAILGTYGARSHREGPLPVSAADEPYPADKLEVIPAIIPGAREYDQAFKFFLDANHPQECATCKACACVADVSVVFPEGAREQAIRNNHDWQARVTTLDFIRRLKSYSRRIRYE